MKTMLTSFIDICGKGGRERLGRSIGAVLFVASILAAGAGYSDSNSPSINTATASGTASDTSTVPGGGTAEDVVYHVIPGLADLSSRLDSLQLELARLRDDVARLRAVREQATSSDRDWTALITELELMKSELAAQREEVSTKRPLMASLDNEGFLLPEETAGRGEVAELESRVQALDGRVQELIQESSEASAVGPRVEHGRISFEGFVHEQFTDGADRESSFDTKRARLGVRGEINSYAQIKIVGEFAGTTKLLDGVLTYSPHVDWSFSVGQYKAPFGTDFLTSSIDMPFVYRTLAADLGPNRDIGISLTYRRQVGGARVKTTAGLFNGSGMNRSDGNDYKNIVVRSEIDLPGGLTAAPNVLIGKTNDTGAAIQDVRNYGGSLRWQGERFTAQGELVYREIDNDAASAWYVWGGPSFTTGWNLVPKVELLARYERYDVTREVSDDVQSRVTLGTNLFADGKYTVMQINYQIEDNDTSDTQRRVLINFQVAF